MQQLLRVLPIDARTENGWLSATRGTTAMVVITLTNCPDALRGDLTKWLLEVNVGVFVGRLSARVRENVWRRVSSHVKEGRATMVFTAANEQRLDFRVANSEWTPVDFDGLKLILRPGPKQREASEEVGQLGYSKAARRLKARRMSASSGPRVARQQQNRLTSYVVVDLETTGLSPDKDCIIELSAVRISGGEATESYGTLVRYEGKIPAKITAITGITDEMLGNEGKDLAEGVAGFLTFIGNDTLVAHNAGFDLAFLNMACQRTGLPIVRNHYIDTLPLSKRLVRDVASHNLKSLAQHFQLEGGSGLHRGLADCMITRLLYEKLLNFE